MAEMQQEGKMGSVRRWLCIMLGARGAAAVAVGSHIHPGGKQSVALMVTDRWKRTAVQMTPDGARRVARQITEWADAAEIRNEELDRTATTRHWQYIVKAALPKSDDAADEPAKA